MRSCQVDQNGATKITSHSKCHQLPILVLDGAKPVIEVAQFTSEKIRRARQTDPKKAAGDDFAKFYKGDMKG
jgi:hypothetical protein